MRSIDKAIRKTLFLRLKPATRERGMSASLAAHSPSGERPAWLVRVSTRMRVSTLFCFRRPGRASHQNSPARPSDKAGPPRFLACRNASVRSFLPSSAALRWNQGGPVSPDGRAASACRMLRTLTSPWTGYVRAERKNLAWGPFFLPSRVGAEGICSLAFYPPIEERKRSSIGLMSQHLLGVGRSLRSLDPAHLVARWAASWQTPIARLTAFPGRWRRALGC
ncbi:hypothetical protein LCGC14_0290260 [marine sediment metagenome]|uniref:Uncharacterized protein n=1 Tax=marine sediment metagenome TaxID=412755 RepID=A0A0F9TYJ7_9ZZZZ